jgi:hypothetical protein
MTMKALVSARVARARIRTADVRAIAAKRAASAATPVAVKTGLRAGDLYMHSPRGSNN